MEPGTKVMIEATVEQAYSVNACVKIKTGQFIWLPTSDLTVCETAEPIDLSNFCIDITNPVNAELLPGFIKIVPKHIYNFDYHYYGKTSGGWFGCVAYNEDYSYCTLPELQKQHPGVFGETWHPDADTRALNIVLDEMNKHEQSPTPSFKAGQEPKDLCAVKTDGTIVCHPYDLGEVITPEECKFIGSWQECLGHIRPIPAQSTVENPEEELKTILNNAYRKGEWGSYLDQEILAWHQKHSGRVEVSVPTKEEIVKYWKELPEGSDAIIDTVIHFMTRKEQQG